MSYNSFLIFVKLLVVHASAFFEEFYSLSIFISFHKNLRKTKIFLFLAYLWNWNSDYNRIFLNP